MAITRATKLAAVGSGLGANPAQPIDVGPGIQMDGSSTGIITATTFSGTATNAGSAVNLGIGATGYGLVLSGDIAVRNITGVAATFSGDIAVRNITGVAATFSGVVTYEDVTNVDSIGIITARSDVSIADKIIHTGDTNTAIRFPAVDTFTVETAGSERVRVDSSGRTLINTPASIQSDDTTQGYTPALQVVHRASNAGTNGISLSRFQAGNANGTPFIFQKSKNDTIGSHTIVADDDQIGLVEFAGSDGADFRTAASISGFVDGTPGTNDMPGRLIFSTSADGAATPTERLRITSAGAVLINSTSASTSDTFLELKNTAAHTELNIISKNDSGALINLGDTDSYNQGRIKYDNAGNNLNFRTAGTDRVIVDSNGTKFGTGNSFDSSSSSGYGVQIAIAANAGTVNAQCISGASQYTQLYGAYAGSNLVFSVLANGTVTATGNVTAYSDISLKENIETIPNALDKVLNLRGVEFDRKDLSDKPHQIGVIAQEVEEVIPEVVLTNEEGIKSVAYGNLVGLLIESIKELKAEVNDLKAKVEG